MKPKFGASVIVCCHNSEFRIVPTIEHLASQRVQAPWEVVLVNNNSTDQTISAAEDAWRRLGQPTALRIVNELEPGLSFARKAGMSQAEFEFVVFCDDDNWLEEHYVQRAMEILKCKPDVGVVGGQPTPVADIELPGWFWRFSEGYAIGAAGLDSCDVTWRGYVFGAGMALRRSVYFQLIECGAKHLLTDRIGTKLCAGGDSEICMWHVLAGFRLWYDESLKLKHFLPASRLTKEYLGKLHEGFRQQDAVLSRYKAVAAAACTMGRRDRWRRFQDSMINLVRGQSAERPIAQAFSPFRWITFDEMTREIQRFAEKAKRRQLFWPESDASAAYDAVQPPQASAA